MVLDQRGTSCSSAWCCRHWLGSAGDWSQRATSMAQLSLVPPNRCLCRAVGERMSTRGFGGLSALDTGWDCAPPASHPCPGSHPPSVPSPHPALGRAPCAWGSLGWWWSFLVVVVIFNLCIVLDLRQRQQVGRTCLALGAQHGKVGSALQLQEKALPPAAARSSRARPSPRAHPKDCRSFQSLLASSPKNEALRMSRVGRKGLPAPGQAQDLVPWGCPVGHELILPLGMRDPTASHPLLKSQESPILPWKPRSPSPGSLDHPVCISPSKVNPAPSKHRGSAGGDSSPQIPLLCWKDTNPGGVSREGLL